MLQESLGAGPGLCEYSYSAMATTGADAPAADSCDVPTSFLNLRVGGDSSQASLPPLAPTLTSLGSHADGDQEPNPALTTTMSTASMYGGGDARTSDGLGSQLSPWELRCDIKKILDSVGGATETEVPVELLHRMRVVMREHISHRKVQRGLATQARTATERALSLQRENQSLRNQINMLTEQLNSMPPSSDNASPDGPSPNGTPLGEKGMPPWAESKQQALRSRESVDVHSNKSDTLSNHELEMLAPGHSTHSTPPPGSSSVSDGTSRTREDSPPPGRLGRHSHTPSTGAEGAKKLQAAYKMLGAERRKNDELVNKNRTLEHRLEELQGEIMSMERRMNHSPSMGHSARLPAPGAAAAAGSRPNTHPDPSATPRRGWGLLDYIRNATATGGGDDTPGGHSNGGSRPRSGAGNDSGPLEGGEWSPTLGDPNDFVLKLSELKMALADADMKLAEMRRTISRLNSANSALSERVDSLRAERDKSWQDVGNLMVQIRNLQAALDGAAIDEAHSGSLRSTSSFKRATSNAAATSVSGLFNPTSGGMFSSHSSRI